jgi:transcription termination factor NusB
MQSSNVLSRLEQVLSDALDKGQRGNTSGSVLLAAMGLPISASNLVDFYGLLNDARVESEILGVISGKTTYVKALRSFSDYFISNNLWQHEWSATAQYIESTNLIALLGLMAGSTHSQRLARVLDENFLHTLKDQVEALSQQVKESDLSASLKNFILRRLAEILVEICRVGSCGESLERIANSLVGELVVVERKFSNDDKKKFIYKKFQWLLATLGSFLTVNAADFIGAVPAIQEYWLPQYEECISEAIDPESEVTPIQEVCEKAIKLFSSHPQKAITGKELKSLPPHVEKQESSPMDENSP